MPLRPSSASVVPTRELWSLVRLSAAMAWRSWRWVPPAFVMVATLLVVYIVKSGPALAAYPLTVVVLVPLAAWLVATVGNVDDAARQQLLAAAASRPLVHASRFVVGVSFALVLALMATAWPLAICVVDPVSGRLGWLRTLALGTAAHGVGAFAGAAFGTWLHRPLLVRIGAAVVIGVGGTMAVVLALLPFLRALAHDRPAALAWVLPGAVAVASVAAAGRTARLVQ